MPTITIKVNVEEKAAVEAAADRAGQNVSEYAREAMKLREAVPDLAETLRWLKVEASNAVLIGEHVDGLVKRVHRLEQMAGID